MCVFPGFLEGRKVPAVPAKVPMSLNHNQLTCGDLPNSVPAESPQVPAEINNLQTPRVLYVATDLSTWAPKCPERIARDCQIDDVVYRRLDPEYFAWLRARMFTVKRAADAGQVPAATFDELRARFNGIQAQAIDLFGEAALGLARFRRLRFDRTPAAVLKQATAVFGID